jgi:hypothetical protein
MNSPFPILMNRLFASAGQPAFADPIKGAADEHVHDADIEIEVGQDRHRARVW